MPGFRRREDLVDWNPALVEQLTELWRAGLSTEEIGRKLGVSKNAVVGKVHRLMLKGPRSRTPRPTCVWPIGYPGGAGFRFCGKRVVAPAPYCHDHAAMAYVQPRKAKQR